MPDPPRRRFSLSDIGILIAAIALGLGLVRYAVSLKLLEIPPPLVTLPRTSRGS